MTVVIRVNFSELTRQIVTPFTPWQRRQILGAMAAKFLFITSQNFGQSGAYRPSPWAPLSKSYAKRVGRPYPTLYLSGDLFRSVRLSVSDEVATVSWEDEKASWHQEGTSRMPARPFLPIKGAGLTPLAEMECIKAAQITMDAILQRRSPSAIY